MEKERIVTKNFVFAFIASFCNSLIFYMLITTVTEFAGAFGAEGAMAGLVSGIFVIGILITRFLFSRILAQIGWRKMMIFSQLLHFASVFLYFTISSLWSLITVRFVHGLCFGLQSSAVLSAGMNQIPKSRYGEGNGYYMTSITLAVAVGPYLGGLVFDSFGARGCFIAAITAAAIMCVSIFSVKLPEDIKKTENAKKEKGLNSLIEVGAIPITLCVTVAAIGYSSVLSFLRIYGHSVQMDSTVSIFFLVYAAVLLVTRPAAGKIQDKYGDAVIMYPCIAMQIVSHVLLALWPTTVGILLSAVLCAAGYGTLSSCVNAVATRGLGTDRKPYAVATYWIGNDLANGLGPVALGAVASAAGYQNMYFAAAAIVVLIAPIYRFMCQKKEKI